MPNLKITSQLKHPLIEAIQIINSNNISDENILKIANIDPNEEFEVEINGKIRLNITLPLYASLTSLKFTKCFIDILGKSVQQKYASNLTMLHTACLSGNKEIVSSLLHLNANAKSFSVTNETSLHFAAILGTKEIMELIYKHNNEVNLGNNSGLTPLHFAAQYDNTEAASFFMAHGALVNQGNTYGFTPLHSAAQYNSSSVMSVFKANGKANQGDRNGVTPTHLAAKYDSEKVIQPLKEMGANFNQGDSKGITPAHIAAFANSSKVIAELKKNGANLDQGTQEGYTPMHIAAICANEVALQKLIESGANIDQGNQSWNNALLFACGKALTDTAHELKKVESLFSSFSFPSISKPNEENYIKIVKLLLHTHKPYIGHKNQKEEDSIQLAEKSGFTNIKKLLKAYEIFSNITYANKYISVDMFNALTADGTIDFFLSLNESKCNQLPIESLEAHFKKFRFDLSFTPDDLKFMALKFNMSLNQQKEKILNPISNETVDNLNHDNIDSITSEMSLANLGEKSLVNQNDAIS